MNKREYLKSFLKPGQKRLPRRLKKLYLKKFYEGGPTLIWTQQQFLNLFIKPNKKVLSESIYNMLNTPLKERYFRVDCGVEHYGTKPKVTCTITDISERKLDNIECKGYLWN